MVRYSKYFVLLQSSKRHSGQMTETNRIEFKRELTRDLDIEREVVAFLNYHEGGVVYIGIDNDGTAVGVKDNDNEDALVVSVTEDFGSVNGSVKSGATTKEIISKLNVSERTIYRELAVLKQMGLIRRVGSDKTGHWEVIKANEK